MPISRDTDGDGVLEERLYYVQNSRLDVVALVDAFGRQIEHVRYSAYGVPRLIPAGDVDGDLVVDTADRAQIRTWALASAYDPRGDLDLDGDVDLDDVVLASDHAGKAGGRGVLSGEGEGGD